MYPSLGVIVVLTNFVFSILIGHSIYNNLTGIKIFVIFDFIDVLRNKLLPMLLFAFEQSGSLVLNVILSSNPDPHKGNSVSKMSNLHCIEKIIL